MAATASIPKASLLMTATTVYAADHNVVGSRMFITSITAENGTATVEFDEDATTSVNIGTAAGAGAQHITFDPPRPTKTVEYAIVVGTPVVTVHVA